MAFIDARDLPEAWFLCVKEVLEKGYEYVIDRGSFVGRKRKEFDYVTVRIRYPHSRPLVPDTPQGVPPPTTMEYVEGYLPYLMVARKKEKEDYTYGVDLEKQIPEIIRVYKQSGYNTNQTYMAVGNAESLFLKDPQCLRGIDTRVRYGALHFIVYFRSWDLWSGFPSNLAAIQLIKEYMAAEIGVECGETIASSKGLHLYDHTWELGNLVVGKANST